MDLPAGPPKKLTAEFQDSVIKCAQDALVVFVLTIWIVFAWTNRPTDVLLPSAVYVAVVGFVISKRIPRNLVSGPTSKLIHPMGQALAKIPPSAYTLVYIGATLTIMVVAIAVQQDSTNGSTADRIRSFCGLLVTVAAVYLVSKDRTKVDFQLVAAGLLAQAVLGLFVLKTEVGNAVFSGLAKTVMNFLGLAKSHGFAFLAPEAAEMKNFVVSVLPAIVFFASFIQAMYYLGVMQWLVIKFAWVMVRLMGTSGSESVVAAASPFVGMGESALLVLPFLEFMTESEIFTVLTSGFSTISGSVLFSFLDMGIDGSILITACIMSVPCSLALSKLSYPETEKSLTKGEVSIPKDQHLESNNLLHAAANGAAQGMTLAGLIFGSILAIVALFALVDNLFIKFMSYVYVGDEINIATVLGYVFWPFAWLLGVPSEDCVHVARLLGTKMVVNEFVAFSQLAALTHGVRQISVRSEWLASMALAGFANIASIGIQVGCLGAMVPNRRGTIARLSVPAMVVGFLCTYCSACIAGIFM